MRLSCYLYKRQAKSQWRPSSLDISSFEKVKPGIRALFLSQKMAQKLSHITCNAYTYEVCLIFKSYIVAETGKRYLPEKKIPSTHAKATSRTAKDIGLQTNGIRSDKSWYHSLQSITICKIDLTLQSEIIKTPLNPIKTPFSLLGNARNGLDSIEQSIFLLRILYICLQKLAVHL